MSYIPIHVHTCWSLLDSTVSIEKLAEKAAEYKLPAVCLTDHGNLKGLVSFHEAMTKRNIIPILGCELNIRHDDNDQMSRFTVLAKNKAGYQKLINAISASNKKNFIIKKQPSLSLEDLIQYRLGLIGLMGDIRSELSFSLFSNWNEAYFASTYDQAKKLLKNDWHDIGIHILEKYKRIFSKNSFFTFTDQGKLPLLQVLNECIKEISVSQQILCLASNNIHYLNEKDKNIHEVILRAAIENERKPNQNLFDFHDYRIFKEPDTPCYLLPALTNGETTLVLLDMIESYSIKERPLLPKFKYKDNTVDDPDNFLYKLCRKGFVNRGLVEELRDDSALKQLYGERVKEELRIFKEIKLSAYFLIVADVIDFCRKHGIPADVRGSSTGCLINYLLGISSVDPMQPDPLLPYSRERELPLSRFYNEGRNTEDHISMPDIDIDCPPHFRETIIEYLQNKYGTECVAHIIVHPRFKGKGAIKEVFRLSNTRSHYEVSDKITKAMTDEAKISDELAEIQEDNPDYGIIQWNIDHIKEIKEASEEHKEIFDLAIALEKIPKNAGVHAAGLIIADRPLSTILPMTYSEKLDDLVVGIEGKDVETLGGFKLDILGVSMLEKCFKIEETVNEQLTEIIVGLDEKL